MADDALAPIAREDLYARVWAKPARDVARDLHISDVGLAKTCRRLCIPLPGRGYWAKHAAGKPVRQERLPPAKPGQPLEWVRDGRQPKRQPWPGPEPVDPAAERVDPDHLPARHPLLVGVEALFAKTRGTSRSGYLRPTKQRIVDVFVSAAALPRALDVINRLFLALERRGHPVSIARHHDYEWRRPAIDETESGSQLSSYDRDQWSPGAPTLVKIGTIALGLTLIETCEGIEMRRVGHQYYRVGQEPLRTARSRLHYSDWTETRNTPTGRFVLRATSPYDGVVWERWWRERTAGDLAQWIEDIVPALERAEPVLRERIAERDREREIARQEAEKRHLVYLEQEKQKQREAAIAASIKHLNDLVDAWTGRVHMEAFFADALECARDLPEAERVAAEARVRRARSLLNPKTPLERLLSWSTPEERVPEELRAGFTLEPPKIEAETRPRMEHAPAAPPPAPELPKSYWETRHWWQRR